MAEEKAAEGNTTYFSEFSSDELDTKLKRKAVSYTHLRAHET